MIHLYSLLCIPAFFSILSVHSSGYSSKEDDPWLNSNALNSPNRSPALNYIPSEEDYAWLDSIILNSPNTSPAHNHIPSNGLHDETRIAQTISSLDNNQLSINKQTKRSKPRVRTKEGREKRRIQQQQKRKEIREQGGEIANAYIAKQRNYSHKFKLSLQNDPDKRAKHLLGRKLAARRQRQKRKQDPIADAEYKRKKKLKMQKKREPS